MKYGKILYLSVFSLVISTVLTSCNDDPNVSGNGSETEALNDGTMPSFSQNIVYWNGETADDGSFDTVGSDGDIYHEANSFRQTVKVTFSEEGATIESANPRILTHSDGGYVTIDFQTYDVSGVNIALNGSTSDGGLKIYGSSKFKLDLNGVSIVSKNGPAINSQCKKRMFVNLADGSTNKLMDASEYGDDRYYLSGSDSSSEDRKGCLFAEGNLIFSGTGTLEINGNYRHGIATDGYMVIRPATTIAVTKARNNCVHIKGSSSESKGLWMIGGLLYCLASSDAGKAVKSDENIIIDGGKVILNTTGNAIIDSEDEDTSSSSCLKTDSYVEINGGNLALRSTGLGGKGINAATKVTVNGGSVGISTSGEKFISGSYSSSPKGMTAIEGIYLNGGDIKVIASADSDGAKAFESDGNVIVTDGVIEAYSYDDAFNSPDFSMTGGCVSAYSINGDGIRGKESVTISAGSITASAGSQSSGISCNSSETFIISGGNIFALGGKIKSVPASANICEVYEDISIRKGSFLNLIGSDQEVIESYKSPRTYTDAIVLVASDKINRIPVNSTTITNQ